jgi:hypothetical protein
MAIGKASDFRIYHDEFYAGVVESIDTNVDLFNEASGGCIRLVPLSHKGDYQKEAFLKDISGAVSRRDTTSVAGATDLAMTMGEEARVKVNRKVGPIAQTLDAWRKVGADSSEMSLRLGQMIGPRILKDQILTAIKAAVNGISNNAGTLHTATGATITYQALIGMLAKFGDMAGEIKTLVFHSKAWFDLVSSMASTTNTLDSVGSLAIQTGQVPGLGRRILVIDSPDLLVAGSPDNYRTLGLVENGVVVMESEGRELVADVVTGLENLVMRIQGEHAFTLGLKGYTWDVTNGGAGPADAAIATGSNWDKVATSDKSTAGVVVRTQ